MTDQLVGDGTTIVAVGDRDGKVVLQFPKPVQWIALDPQTAVQVGEAMARASHKIATGQQYNGSRRALTTGLRDRLVTRCVLVMNNLQQRKKSPNYIAQQLVDIIFSEVE